MNYKLVKQLRKAGYPSSKEITLSNLIDACGDDFYVLTQLLKKTGHKKDEWIASGQGNCPQLIGKTKKEAVTKLFIKLNGKNKSSH